MKGTFFAKYDFDDHYEKKVTKEIFLDRKKSSTDKLEDVVRVLEEAEAALKPGKDFHV